MFSWQQILAFVVWVPVGVWIHTVIGWLVMDEVDTGSGLLALGVGVSLGLAGSFAPDRSLSWLPFSIALLTVSLFPLVNEKWRKYELFRIELEKIQGIYDKLRGNRSDVYGLTKLAECLHDRGLNHPAIALMDGALKGQPRDLFQNEFRVLAKWRLELGAVPLRAETTCLHCGLSNVGSSCFCGRCGSDYLLDIVRRRYVGFTSWGLLFGVWATLAGFVAAAPFLFGGGVSPEVRLTVGIAAVALAVGAIGFFVVKGVKS